MASRQGQWRKKAPGVNPAQGGEGLHESQKSYAMEKRTLRGGRVSCTRP